MDLSIKSASRAEEEAVIGVIIAAFLTDPVARWMCPEPHQYFAVCGSFIRAFAGNAFANGSAYYADDFASSALWLPPGIHPAEEAMSAIMKSSIAARQARELACQDTRDGCG